MSWFGKAAEQGDADAQYFLGEMCDLGLGVARNHAEAVFWYRKAAEQGNAAAQGALRELEEALGNTSGSSSEAQGAQPSLAVPTEVSQEDIREMIQAAMKDAAGGQLRSP